MRSPSCLPDLVPRCCFPVPLLFCCLWPIFHMWSFKLSPRFGFPDIGSWSGSCFVVFHLFPRCGLPVVSWMWFLRCCHPFLLLFSCLPPLSQIDVASQLSRICGFPDAVFQLPPVFLHVLSSCLPLVSRDVVSKLPSYWNLWQFWFVSQNWTSNYLHMSSIRCPVVF